MLAATYELSSLLSPDDLDPNFGIGGIVTTDFSGGGDGATSLVLQPDGKIVVGGTATVAGGPVFAVARYNADGSLDSGFGMGGRVTTTFAATPAFLLSQ